MSGERCTLSFRGAPKSGPVFAGGMTIPERDVFRRAARITFMVHGYDKDEKNGKIDLKLLPDYLDLVEDGIFVAVLWPGDHWLRKPSYPLEGRDADLTAYHLFSFIRTWARRDAELNFVSHSLGARVVMGAVDRLAEQEHPVNQICLMAGAIDADSLACDAVYRRATKRAKRVAVLSSTKDNVLRFAYPAGDLFQSFLFKGDTPGLALGYRGPRPHKKIAVPMNVHDEPIDKDRDSDHGDYLPKEVATAKAKKNQESAAGYANLSIGGELDPQYS